MPKSSSLNPADCVVDSAGLNASICLTCHVSGTVPHFSAGDHADAPVNPFHGSVNTDYETTFYPTDANTKHLGGGGSGGEETPFCRLFHSPAVAISCSESGDCSIRDRTPHDHPMLIPLVRRRVSQSQGRWLAFIVSSLNLFHSNSM